MKYDDFKCESHRAFFVFVPFSAKPKIESQTRKRECRLDRVDPKGKILLIQQDAPDVQGVL